jgi:hypothetical protein
LISEQLCELEGFDQALLETIKEKNMNVLVYRENSVSHLLKDLVINPVRKIMRSTGDKKIAVVLDALDECDDPKSLMKAIIEVWKEAPDWFVLLVSTRDVLPGLIPERGAGLNHIRILNEKNVRDVKLYLNIRVQCKWNVTNEKEAKGILNILETKSEAQFLWISFQEPILDDLVTEYGRLTLKIIEETKFPKGMNETYQRFFKRLRDSIENDDKEMYRRAVALAIPVPRELIPEELWREAIGLRAIDDEANEQYARIKTAAKSLLLFTDDGRLKSPHKSMVDWIQNQNDVPELVITTSDKCH